MQTDLPNQPLSPATNSLNSLNLTQHEVKVFLGAKKSVTIDYIYYFITYIVSLYETVADTDNKELAMCVFEGMLKNKETKDASIETSNTIANELKQLPGIISTMQSEIVSQAVQSKFTKLRLIKDKHTAEI